MDFAVPADKIVKLKESEKKHKYMEFTRELKKPWNMKETFISIVNGVFRTVSKGLEDLEIKG